MLAIVDYNMGNLQSVLNAFRLLGADATVTRDHDELANSDAIVLPGVGAFGDGMKNLAQYDLLEVLDDEVIHKKKPLLGICLGMQLMADEGTEHGVRKGLGWVRGVTQELQPCDGCYKVPHMGWNDVLIKKQEGLFQEINQHSVYYFVHSYALCPVDSQTDCVSAMCWHGEEIVAAVEKDNIFGVQFHPEKSQGAGLKLLENFLYIARR